MSLTHDASRTGLRRQWNAVLGRLELEMNRHNFETWLRGTEPLRLDGRRLIIEARHGVSCDWLNGQLACLVGRAVEAIFGEGVTANFVPQSSSQGAPPTAEGQHAPDPTPADGGNFGPGEGQLLGTLNRNFTFERYLPAAGNRLALQACLDLVSGEPQPATPVVMFGAPGLGKTHLLHALAAKALSQGWSVACLGAEEFTNLYQGALRDEHAEEFHRSIRSVRLLVIDDLQYLPGKSRTVDEFVLTLDAVTNAGGVVACASERHPAELNLPPRLVSRLSAGVLAMMAGLEPTDRRAYFDARAREQRLSLPGWAVDRVIACNAPSIRVLQGLVNKALMLQRTGQLEPASLDTHLVHSCLSAAAQPAALDQRGVIEAVAAHFGISFDEMVGYARHRVVNDARAIAMAALVERHHSLSQVAALFGGRNRSTVKEVSARGRELLAGNPALRARLVS